MINDLYLYIESSINKSKIYDKDAIKSRFLLGITSFFEKWVPGFDESKQSIESIIRSLCEKVSKKLKKDSEELFIEVSNELDNYVMNWQYFLDMNVFILRLVDGMYNRYKSKDRINFNDVIYYTLSSNYHDGVVLDDEKIMRFAIMKLLDHYFLRDKNILFTRENGARQYVMDNTKDDILNEITEYLGLFEEESIRLDINDIFLKYTDKFMLEYTSLSSDKMKR